MNSEEINAAIIQIDDHGCETQKIYKSCIGDKIIPYIGWFWRPVNFDKDFCYLGILPTYNKDDSGFVDHNDVTKVGFMENNKWGYDRFKIKGDQWKTLKELIVESLEWQDGESFNEVDLYMQSLLPKKYRK
jgi:hypothetical protein